MPSTTDRAVSCALLRCAAAARDNHCRSQLPQSESTLKRYCTSALATRNSVPFRELLVCDMTWHSTLLHSSRAATSLHTRENVRKDGDIHELQPEHREGARVRHLPDDHTELESLREACGRRRQWFVGLDRSWHDVVHSAASV